MSYLNKIDNLLLIAFNESDGPYFVRCHYNLYRFVESMNLTKDEISVLATEDAVKYIEYDYRKTTRRLGADRSDRRQ